MRSSQWLFLGYVITILLFGAGCGKKEGNSRTSFTVPISVKTVAVEKGDIEVTRSFGGDVMGIEQSDIYARIPEVVVGVSVELGQRVKSGQVLLNLDREGSNSRYLQAKAGYENARKDYERMEFLFGQKAVSEQSYDRAATAYKVAEADFNAAASLVELKSPIDGVITSISVTLGQQAIIGKPLVTVAKVDSVLIRFMVGESDARRIRIGTKAGILLDESRGSMAEGKVTKVSDSADPGTRGFEVEIAVDNENGWFKPGTFVRVRLVLDKHEDILLVPSSAAFIREGERYVFMVINRRAKLMPVVVGEESENMIYIKSGINQGDQVITVGSNLVIEGDSLNILENH